MTDAIDAAIASLRDRMECDLERRMLEACTFGTSTAMTTEAGQEPLTVEKLLAAIAEVPIRPPTPALGNMRFAPAPDRIPLRVGGRDYCGFEVIDVDAQAQRRTPRDVKGPWVRPRCPSKRGGRRGTRRAWKRANPPHQVWRYREPTDVVVIEGRQMIATPHQLAALRRATVAVEQSSPPKQEG